MHREKDELLENQYKRDFLTYDNQLLDGDIFLQVPSDFEAIRHGEPLLNRLEHVLTHDFLAYIGV